ncbi:MULTISPECIES: hypothetical protein [unclassified Paenibacillus]|uniref:hypothetical protein n=1 Tax=unclassified Paenibacillus TaxID=185978 RepID=UPI0036313192
MSREISQDAAVLTTYLKDFDLSESISNPQYLNYLKSMHKKSYGYLLFLAELEQQYKEISLVTELSITYYKETASDLMQSIFCWSVGSYKTANLTLRSAIETFLKAILGNDNAGIYDEKSVYKIFEIASQHSFFLNDIGKNYYTTIHALYKELCMFAHSARNVDLGSIASLNLLPRYDHKMSSNFNSFYLKLLDSILGIILLNYNALINNMHPLNKGIFLSTMTLKTKKEIFEAIEDGILIV